MLIKFVITLIIIIPIAVLVTLLLSIYKGLKNKDEKKRFAYTLLIGFAICLVFTCLGFNLSTTGFGRFITGGSSKCIFTR